MDMESNAAWSMVSLSTTILSSQKYTVDRCRVHRRRYRPRAHQRNLVTAKPGEGRKSHYPAVLEGTSGILYLFQVCHALSRRLQRSLHSEFLTYQRSACRSPAPFLRCFRQPKLQHALRSTLASRTWSLYASRRDRTRLFGCLWSTRHSPNGAAAGLAAEFALREIVAWRCVTLPQPLS